MAVFAFLPKNFGKVAGPMKSIFYTHSVGDAQTQIAVIEFV